MEGMQAMTQEERIRYSRQMSMPEFGEAAQERLRQSRVLLIGAGGLGSPAAQYLAAAGVGELGMVDNDAVELSNLHRQLLHGTSDVGRRKIESASERLREINPHVRVQAIHGWLTAENALEMIEGWDVVIDGSDNFPTRYASNDACVALGIPNVFGSIWRFEGQVSVFAPHLGGPCYRCLNPHAPPPCTVPSCAEAGVLGVLPGLIGTLQALETLKLLTGLGKTLVGRLLHVEALTLKFREFALRVDPQCERCAEDRRTSPLRAEGAACEAVEVKDISVRDLQVWRKGKRHYTLLDVREDWEVALSRLDPLLHIPLGQLEKRLAEIPQGIPLFVMCHSGIRSAAAVRLLTEAGYPEARNVRGGMVAWIAEIGAEESPS